MQSLKEMCCFRIAKYIALGRLQLSYPIAIPLETSSMIFSIILNDHGVTKKSLECMNNMLPAPIVSFNGELTEECIQAISQQDILSLDLMAFKNWHLIFEPPSDDSSEESDDDMEEMEDNLPLIDIAEFLKKLLNQETQKNLKHLGLLGEGVDFKEHWLREIAAILPTLDSLRIDDYFLEQDEFNDICSSFVTLRKLEITVDSLETIDGISNLKRLTYLNLFDCSQLSKESFKDLGNLKSLKILDIGEEVGDTDLCHTLSYLMEHGIILPELRFLDCSFNNIDQQMFAVLIENHKNLEMINLIGTPLQTIPQYKSGNRSIRLLTVENISECIKSFDYHFSANFQFGHIEAIVDRLKEILTTEFDQDPEDLKKCLDQLCKTYFRFLGSHDKQVMIVECFEQFFKAQRASKISLEDKEKFASIVFKNIKTFRMSGAARLTKYGIIFRILVEDMFLELSDEYKIFLAKSASRCLCAATNFKGGVVLNCSRYLWRTIPDLDKNLCDSLVDDVTLKTKILEFAKNDNVTEYLSLSLFGTLTALYQKRPQRMSNDNEELQDENCLKEMIDILGMYRAMGIATSAVFNTVKTMMKIVNKSVLEVFMRSRSIRIFSKLVHSDNTNEQITVLTIFSGIYYRYQLNDADEAKIHEMSTNLVWELSGLEYNEESRFLATVERIEAQTVNQMVRNWCQWMVSLCET